MAALQHLLSIEQLTCQQILDFLDLANTFLDQTDNHDRSLLQGKTVATLFFEPSTRTRCSFHLAAKRLGATVIDISVNTSSVLKGESLLDTLKTLQAMDVNLFVLRHPEEGIVESVAQVLGSSAVIVNAGDGSHEHPTQALLDMLTIRQCKKTFSTLKVALIGDIKYSRVAHSQLWALKKLQVHDLRLIAPKELLPDDIKRFGVTVFYDMKTGLHDVDVIITGRLQHERMTKNLQINPDMFHQQYGLTKQQLTYAKIDAIVMHAAPLNRGVEIDSDVADGPQSVILKQVRNGVALRMAVMKMLLEQKT